MPAGRPPKPTALKVLQGNPGKRAINESEPKFKSAEQRPPEWLKGYGRDLWIRLAPKLIEQGVLTEVDRDLFAAGCERWGVYRRATDEAFDLLAESKAHGMVTNPLQALAKSALNDATSIFREFGIGAASRSKVKVNPPEVEDKFARDFA